MKLPIALKCCQVYREELYLTSVTVDMWINSTVLLLLFVSCLVTASRRQPRSRIGCGYNACEKVYRNKLNIHLISHTHDDVGWVKTFDEYYHGSKKGYYNINVKDIIHSAVNSLLVDKSRRFIYVEMAFFWRWWLEQSKKTQHQVKELVSEGRLEFIGGAWSMNDEAAVNYVATIDQFTWGLRKLNDTFGACGRPRVAWQIDPFGHSREMASLFAQMGYDGLLFGRLDYQDKKHRLATKKTELIWEGSPSLGPSADIFTSILYNLYQPPPTFCFDIVCPDEHIEDDESNERYNIETKMKTFIKYARKQATYYSSKNIAITMGGDFTHKDAEAWFRNMDKMIKYANMTKPGINLIYSTPSCYIKAVNDAGLKYTTKKDDFFPYASAEKEYWTGYYTSRPTSKYLERLSNNFLQVVKQLEAMASLGQKSGSKIDTLREAMGVMQHHDAISGTEKQYVADDYANMLSNGLTEAHEVAENAINKIMSTGSERVKIHSCLRLNISECHISESADKFVIVVYNPLSHHINYPVRIPVAAGEYEVLDSKKVKQIIQLVPIPEMILNLPERQSRGAAYDLVFIAQELPPHGYRTYHITKVNNTMEEIKSVRELTLGGKHFQVKINKTTGLVDAIDINGAEFPLTQNFYYYEGHKSGAYIFKPKESIPLAVSSSTRVRVFKGEVVHELHQFFSPWASQIVRIYRGENNVEFEWMIGPFPNDAQSGMEVVTRYTTDLANDGIFYTDANGRELLERKRNFRPTWNVTITEAAAGNYYPVTSRILIRDKSKGREVAVLNDRSQGGSSLNDGEIELMLHRFTTTDDGKGVDEPLDERQLVARGKHYLMAGDINGPSPNLAVQERELVQKKLVSPWIFFTGIGINFDDWNNKFKMEFSGLKSPLPINIQIITLEPWRDRTLLLRFEHIMEVDEDIEFTKKYSLDFMDLFTTFTISSSRETTLAANQWMENMRRLVWKSKTPRPEKSFNNESDILHPMQIRTFVINVQERISGGIFRNKRSS